MFRKFFRPVSFSATRIFGRKAWIAAAWLASAGAAQADTVWVRSNENAAPLPYQNVRITSIQSGELHYQLLSNGRDTSRPLQNVSRILLEGEPLFSGAEQAFDEGDYKKAAAGYQRLLASGVSANREWAKDRAAARLVEANDRTGDVSGAVAAYINLLNRNADLAAKFRPAIPKDKPQLAAAAAPVVEKAITAQAAGPQRQALELLLADLYAAAGKTGKAAEMVDRVAGAASAGTAPPAAAKLQTDLKLRAAAAALEQKEYARALADLEGAAAAAEGPPQQADAMYFTAQARAGLAADANSRLDAALGYMNIVARFKQAAGKPRVADSLLRAAEIMESVQARDDARALYQQAAQEFPGSAAAQQAQAAVERIGQSKDSSP